MKERCCTFSFRKLPLALLKLLFAAFVMAHCLPAMAQSGIRVTGLVTSEADGLPLIGVNVVQTGTANGTVTDIDGKYDLTVPANAVLDFSYIGFIGQKITISTGKTVYNVILREDSQSLDEVVVVGYGVQKKKLLTGATIQVSGDDLTKLSTSNVLTALQSQAPGVSISQTSGQPGEGFKVTIRGLGTVGDSKPLYVVDGVAGVDFSLLNPSDIESIDVLKDAASAAIYGARAANGVILVTTKQGKSGKVQISYDGYYGQQYMYKMPDMLNAREYMTIQDEVRYNDGNLGFDWANLLPGYLYNSVMDGSWQGTNWVKEFYNKAAPTQNHSINLTGGNDISKFSMGYSYTEEEGILGKPVQSEFKRSTARINSDHVLLKVGDMEVVKIGQTLNYSYRERSGISTGNQYWNALYSVVSANPLFPVYTKDGDWYDYYAKAEEGWTFDGGMANPIANTAMTTQGLNLNKNHNVNMSAFIQIQPIKNLVFRSQFGYKMSASSYRDYNQTFRLSNNSFRENESVGQNQSVGYSWTLDNTISYLLNSGLHTTDIVLGQSAEKWGIGENVGSGGQNNIFSGDWKYAWVDNMIPKELSQRSASGGPWGNGALASFFGRFNYNYGEKYMATVILRTDGSSNFSKGNRWGYFPSVAAGWIITSEDFMESVQTWMDFLKIRASWGRNGNQAISNFQYLSTYAFDAKNLYYFGKDKTTPYTGGYADILKNPDVTWETAESTDIGFDARFLNSRLGAAFSWYKKTTKDWLVEAPILATYGLNAPYINGGDVENTGIELGLTWNDRVGDFTYGVNLNFDYGKNEVTRIANAEGIIHGDQHVLSQGTTEMYRAQVGYPMGYFYGYKTEGIFQNWEQVNATQAKYPGAQPGDVIFADTNGDGVISEEDRVMIGNPHPDYKVGFSLNFGYKGFDLGVTTFGEFGHQIAKSYRRFADSPYQNYTTAVFGRWTGEGTSNKLPRLTSGSHINWQNISDIYMEDADFLRIQNITFGYDFKKLFPKMPLGQARVYVSAQNLYTFTGYSGMETQIGYGADKSWVRGIDIGYYPYPRVYQIGVNLKF